MARDTRTTDALKNTPSGIAKKAATKITTTKKAPVKTPGPRAKVAKPAAKVTKPAAKVTKPAGKGAKPALKPVAAKKAPAAKRAAPARKTGISTQRPTSSGTDKQRFTLYGITLSTPTYAVGLMLSLSNYPFSYIHVNLREGAHKQPDFLVKNRFGQVPALRDGQVFISQSSAILEYLAEALGKFDGKTPLERQRIREWLFWQWDKLFPAILRLRARVRGFRQFGDEVRTLYEGEAKAGLAMLDQELAKSDWLVGKRPTIADIALYAVLRVASEAHVDLGACPHVVAWKKRFEALPGFAPQEDLLPMESRLL